MPSAAEAPADDRLSEDRLYDVAIVGAGPAGANAALHLARAGARVVLVEKHVLPRDKTCGGGLVWRAWRELPAGLELPIEHVCRVAEANLASHGLAFRVERTEPIVSMTMRAEFDHALVRAACAAGAELRTECTVTALETRADRVVLATSAGSVEARWVVAADGVLGKTAALAGWTDTLASIPALEAEVRVAPDVYARFAASARFDLDALPRGYGWVFPKREHLSCGVGAFARGRVKLHEALDVYLARLGIVPVEPPVVHGYVIPVRPRRVLARGRVLLVGDAAGLADPLTAEGISIALCSGKIAAEAISAGAISTGGGDAALVRRTHTRRTRREIVRDLALARRLAYLLYERPALGRALLRRRGQVFAEALVLVVTGERTYRDLLLSPRSYWKLWRKPGAETAARV
jgi:geranylgeranyl reductase family protein